MGVNMKELPPDKHHLQAKMKEWLDANQETYSQFKDKIQSALKNQCVERTVNYQMMK